MVIIMSFVQSFCYCGPYKGLAPLNNKKDTMIAATTVRTVVKSLIDSKGSGSNQSSLSHHCQPWTASSGGDNVSEGTWEQPEFTLLSLPDPDRIKILECPPQCGAAMAWILPTICNGKMLVWIDGQPLSSTAVWRLGHVGHCSTSSLLATTKAFDQGSDER